MKKIFLKKMKNRLIKERNDIISKMTSDLVLDNQIDIDGDEADEVQANLIIYMNNQFYSRNKTSIDKIDQALNKIDKDEYGYCEECGEEILEKRLEFNPYFTECIICAEQKEKRAKNK
jgi:DnaK suppressor protein